MPTRHKVVSPDKWMQARRKLLAKEKAFTRARDRLSRDVSFNFDCRVSFTPEEMKRKKALYNFKLQDPGPPEREGISVFFKDPDGRIFRTYSTYARGIEALNLDYRYLDIVPKGRDEGGRGPYWVRRHDEYGR